MNALEIVKLMEENDVKVHDVVKDSHAFSMLPDDKKGKKHVCMAIPINREITAESFVSFMQMYSHLSKNYNVSLTCSVATYLHEGRALILKNAYDINSKAPIDYMLWVDSDMVYNIDDFEKCVKMMERKNINYLSALYFTKRRKACKPVFLLKKGEDYHLAESYKKHSLLKVDGVGFGFFLCKFPALKALVEKYENKIFTLKFDEQTGRMIGEDVIFSKRVTEMGDSLWVWTDIIVGHEGGTVDERYFWAVNPKAEEPFNLWKKEEEKTSGSDDSKKM